MRRKSRNSNRKTPLRAGVLAGASSVVVASVVALFATGTVQADVRLFRSASAPAVSPAGNATPASLAPQVPADQLKEHRLHGLASWYGGIFNGRKTASGERFNMYAMTACHPTLPFGSVVRVINRENHRSVVVKITDRGDLIDQKRIIDLSYAAAQKLAMVHDGLAPVDLQVLSLGRESEKK